MKRPQVRARAGFTLIELLVAISILAIVAVLGWRGLDGIVRARLALTEQMEQTRGMQLAFAQMQSDAEHLADRALLRQRPNLLAEDGRLTLVRTVLAENQPSQIEVVAYRLIDGKLTRRESNATRDLIVLDALWQAALGDTDTSARVLLQSGVTQMTLRTWQNSEWRIATGAAPVQSNTEQDRPAALTAAAPPASGLEVALRLQDQQAAMVKVFFLGPL
ncbi:MAG: general secretion pathway protein J [Janthinobacterium sp.]|jgi:general secretion pathway protein J